MSNICILSGEGLCCKVWSNDRLAFHFLAQVGYIPQHLLISCWTCRYWARSVAQAIRNTLQSNQWFQSINMFNFEDLDRVLRTKCVGSRTYFTNYLIESSIRGSDLLDSMVIQRRVLLLFLKPAIKGWCPAFPVRTRLVSYVQYCSIRPNIRYCH